MPHGEDRPRDGGHGHVRESRAGEGGCEAGVLHANLDGDCFFAREVHLEEDGDQVAAQISEQVVKNHDGEDDEAGGQYFGTVVGDDGCYDEADGGHRDSGQEVRDLLGVFAEEFVDQEAEADGDQDDLDDGQEHGLHVNADGGAQVEVGERGRQEGREQGVDAGHAYGQGCVAAGQVGDDVAGGASGAGSDQDYADEQFVAEAEDFAEAESQQGHDHKLGHAAGDDVLGLFEYDCEISQLHCQAHAEHDDHEKIVDPLGLYPEAGAGQEECEGGYDQDDPCHVFADKITDFFHKNILPFINRV